LMSFEVPRPFETHQPGLNRWSPSVVAKMLLVGRFVG
jgi:hypothetical protein